MKQIPVVFSQANVFLQDIFFLCEAKTTNFKDNIHLMKFVIFYTSTPLLMAQNDTVTAINYTILRFFFCANIFREKFHEIVEHALNGFLITIRRLGKFL